VRSNKKTKTFLKLKWTRSARLERLITLKASPNAMPTLDLKHGKNLMLNNELNLQFNLFKSFKSSLSFGVR